MSDFETSWALSRKRFVDEVSDLDTEQLRWRLHPGTLSIGEMALHVAGVEVSFATQLLGLERSAMQERLKAAATEGVVNDHPFPFEESEIDAEQVHKALAQARHLAEQVIIEPSAEILSKQIKSALGPVITGDGALARLAFHPAYHQGQAYLVRNAPGFPQAQR
jgi:uncharacterized damage-inducible protein DinB